MRSVVAPFPDGVTYPFASTAAIFGSPERYVTSRVTSRPASDTSSCCPSKASWSSTFRAEQVNDALAREGSRHRIAAVKAQIVRFMGQAGKKVPLTNGQRGGRKPVHQGWDLSSHITPWCRRVATLFRPLAQQFRTRAVRRALTQVRIRMRLGVTAVLKKAAGLGTHECAAGKRYLRALERLRTTPRRLGVDLRRVLR